MKILLVHHTAHHFETLMAFFDALRYEFDVSIWSNSLARYDRVAILDLMAAPIYLAGDDFDLSVVITYDEPLTVAKCPEQLLKRIVSKPIIKVLHRYNGQSDPDQLFLFPPAPSAFIPVSLGAIPSSEDKPLSEVSEVTRFLIQGNVEGRRNYAALHDVVSNEGNFIFHIVGKRVTEKLTLSHPKIKLSYDLSELDFRSVCSSCHFICPLIDPLNYKQYFTDRFSSSVQAGFAFGLPFVAHKRLFDLYPITGLAYDDSVGFADCMHNALTMSQNDYRALKGDLAIRRASVEVSNLATFKRVLSSRKDPNFSR